MARIEWTDEQKRAQAARMRRNWSDPEWRAEREARIRAAHKPRPQNAETRAKLSRIVKTEQSHRQTGKRSHRGWHLFEILERRYGPEFVDRIPEPEVRV